MRIETDHVGGQTIRYAVTIGWADICVQPPLLVFNGIGASLELMTPVIEALGRHGISVVAFDVPGTGGSPTPTLPYRLPRVARMARDLLHHLQIGTVDALGVSWGGALAQEFVHQYPHIVRRLVLAATSPGVVMVPGQPSALLRLVSPRRYFDPAYMTRVGGHLYGGVYRSDPDALHEHGRYLAPPAKLGYLFQLLATSGWSSLPWLRSIRQPTLVLMGRDDPIVPPVNGRILASMIPHARLHVLPCGHLFLLSRTSESVGLIAEFLEPKMAHASTGTTRE
ncbi:MAG TPA: poly(3-hydroxyalkanoate) depolymerase [Acetobacteraceae bacterium]|nr:poly(3-hydroxyalkanoate) depolymerase [Acetobacteraceae bacterium]